MKKRQNQEPGREARIVLAVNLKKLMEDWPQYGSNAKLGKQAKVAPNSVRNMLHPGEGNATLDNIAKVAAVFQLEVWQILHPDIPVRAMSLEEAKAYEAAKRMFSDSEK